MLIFGTIGVFVKQVQLASSEIAFLRAVIGSLFLVFASLFVKQKLSFTAIRENFVLLFVSGTAIGVNWILLFEAYKYTSVSNATISYYFAPVFVIILAPFVLKEKLTITKVLCVTAAMIGLLLVVNIRSVSSGSAGNNLLGIGYGLAAAVLYASVILMNKFIKKLSGFETTLVQLATGAVVLLPYILLKENINLQAVNSISVIYILILGIVHTGIAYFLYFTSVKALKGQTIAVLSYIDPISAVIFAALFLGESMSLPQIAGGILIIGSTFLSERVDVKTKKQVVA
jgi:RarD protein